MYAVVTFISCCVGRYLQRHALSLQQLLLQTNGLPAVLSFVNPTILKRSTYLFLIDQDLQEEIVLPMTARVLLFLTLERMSFKKTEKSQLWYSNIKTIISLLRCEVSRTIRIHPPLMKI
ncbi:hypothetical protein C0Q44_27875 [Paenibacillus sp. PCH8]|nr:hypothetical protein C0Q44_27875 [Paenibacillus sp. PCH8]